jgi:hypothetical protein
MASTVLCLTIMLQWMSKRACTMYWWYSKTIPNAMHNQYCFIWNLESEICLWYHFNQHAAVDRTAACMPVQSL